MKAAPGLLLLGVLNKADVVAVGVFDRCNQLAAANILDRLHRLRTSFQELV